MIDDLNETPEKHKESKGFLFSRHPLEDLNSFLAVLPWFQEAGVQIEFLDAVLSELEKGRNMNEAIFFARSEWDV